MLGWKGAPKRDRNEPEIRAALERFGYTSWPLSDRDIPDLLCVKRGKIILVEVKFAKAKLSEGQQRFFYSSQILGFPAYVVRELKDIELMDAAEFSDP